MTAVESACLWVILMCIGVLLCCITLLLATLRRDLAGFIQAWLIAKSAELLTDQLPTVKPRSDR